MYHESHNSIEKEWIILIEGIQTHFQSLKLGLVSFYK